MENYKKLEIPEDAVATYDIQHIFTSIQALGYSITDIKLSQSEPESPEDPVMLSIMFDITGLPIISNDDDGAVQVEYGKARVNIYSAETIHDHKYYVEDISMSNFVSTANPLEVKMDWAASEPALTYRSFALDSLFYALIKTMIVINVDNSQEKPQESDYN